jgi:resuscitation-promoting factor RpfB
MAQSRQSIRHFELSPPCPPQAAVSYRRNRHRARLGVRSVVLSVSTIASLTTNLSAATAETPTTTTTGVPASQSWSAQVIPTDKVSQTLADQAANRLRAVTTEVATTETSVTSTSAKPSRVVRTPKSTKPATKVVAPIAALAVSEFGTANTEDSSWAALRKCESGGRYALNTGNGYYGAYQFSLATWQRLGFSGYPHEASSATQDAAAKRLQAKAGWGQWPACARKLGLR